MENKGKAIAIGTFDGVHTGHQAVLGKLKEISQRKDLEPVAVTFDRHPLSLINPLKTPKLITTLSEKIRLLRQNGVTPLVLSFDVELRSITAADWIKRMKEELGAEEIVAGYDNTFGSDGVNLSLSDYKKIGEKIGVGINEAPFVSGVSSSAIRKAVEAGKIEESNYMLGRPFSLSGEVVNGNKLGRTIGFPTANLSIDPTLLVPRQGVYVATAELPDGKIMPAMVNIGIRPTIKRGEETTIETYIIDWTGDLYGKNLTVVFHDRLRDEEDFKTIDQLRRQLMTDRVDALSVLQKKNII